MSEQGGDGSVGVIAAPVMVPDVQAANPLDPTTVDAEIAAVTNGVTELQLQVQQLQEQQKLSEEQNQNLMVSLESEKAKNNQSNATSDNDSRIQQLERELQLRTEERENYRNKLEVAEKLIADLKMVKDANLENKSDRGAVQDTIEKMTVTLKEQTDQCERFERQNTQLMNQVKALKEVISVHKDLLAIRSLETDQLKTTIKLLEEHAKAEKDRRNAVLAKMESAVKLNAELKTEYETQLRIFTSLKEKYELKHQLLIVENERLRKIIPPELFENLEDRPQNEEPVVEQ